MLTLDQVKSKSAKRLTGLHPVVLAAADKLIERAFARGVSIIITQGLRTIEYQNELYAQGRTKPGPIVTNAKGGRSFHNYGVAIDFALLLPDGRSCSWDMTRDGNGNKQKDWIEVVDEAKKLGFEWGGDWPHFRDYPHLQMTFGLTINDYAAGRRPKPTAPLPTEGAVKPVTVNITVTKEKLEALEERIAALEAANHRAAVLEPLRKRLETLEEQHSMSIPHWAEKAVSAAVGANLIDMTDNGSFDFYRLLTVLYRKGLL
ncbi:hypothetical protein PAECIP111893_03526 [Paenibacillus plantiphilus]|uniref:Peptidase M15C domain-containing protein n=1 Tax=Paenibacillus plantiphilus TaxID=2905650 RepID=A0ABN8GLV2_9BACL|nr:M15 family metallopeptidase [Paenibacillus plantiphilus]CAH1212365.1 hypothetical protein PAECIP111893_03526 [Paenibacillus plantiphilus]